MEGTAPAAWKMVGQQTSDGWQCVERLTKSKITSPDLTGGNFSVGYIVKKQNQNGNYTAYLKAFDIEHARRDPETATKKLTELLINHKFENDLLSLCKYKKMDRIIFPIESGEIRMSPALEDYVPFIVMQLASCDSRREYLNRLSENSISWKLRALHHTAVGLRQLHSCGISHQDIKPSNILKEGKESYKICDLGRSKCKSLPSLHDNCRFSGDSRYAPPEFLYSKEQQVDNFDPNKAFEEGQKFDLYMLGGLLFFYFTGRNITELLFSQIC